MDRPSDGMCAQPNVTTSARFNSTRTDDTRHLAFVYESLPGRIIFGVGSVTALADEVHRIGAKRILAITTGSAPDDVLAPLGNEIAARISTVRVHVPVEDVDNAESVCLNTDTDLTVCAGGGSAIGLAKALAHRRGQPFIAIPTTYAGSEMTSIYGITSGNDKRTARDPNVLPRSVIYDPALTTGLPATVTSTSGMNALAHCVEALYSKDRSPLIELMAAEGVRALVAGLPTAVEKPADLAARTACMLGAYMAGSALGSSSMGLHHRLCHVLGGMSRAGHGDLNAIVLPHIIAFNASAAPSAMTAIEAAMNVDDAAGGMYDFARRLRAPASLSDAGVEQRWLEPVAAATAAEPVDNPRPYAIEQVRELLQAMYEGVRPSIDGDS